MPPRKLADPFLLPPIKTIAILSRRPPTRRELAIYCLLLLIKSGARSLILVAEAQEEGVIELYSIIITRHCMY
jgi:hypothetical protein